MIRTLRFATAFLLVAGLVSAAFVGRGDRSEDDAARRVAAAAGTSFGADGVRTARWSLTLRSTLPDAEFDVTTTSVGEFDVVHHRSSVVTTGSAERFRMVEDGGRIVIELPMARWSEFAGKTWAPVLRTARASDHGDRTKPPDYAQLRRAKGARVVGREVVRGVPTTHIHTVVDERPSYRRLFADAKGDAGPAISQLERVPLDVWLDDDDRPRKVRETLAVTFPPSLGGTKLRTTTTTELYDLDEPVHIEVPDPDEVADRPVDLRTLFGTPAPGGK